MFYSKTIEKPHVIINGFQKKFNEEEDQLKITRTSVRRALADIAAGRVYVGHIPEHLKK